MTTSSDPSLRFVLADDAPFLANLAALWAHDPKLAAAIEALDATASYPTSPSKSGVPTVCGAVGRREGDPPSQQVPAARRSQEAHRRAASGFVCDVSRSRIRVGYHVEHLFESASAETTICVMENDLLLLRTAMELRDFSKLVRSNRVIFFWQLDKAALFTRLMSQSASAAMGF